jgi:hypothetical protein
MRGTHVGRRGEMKGNKIRHGRMLKYSSTRKEDREECGIYHDNEANGQKKKDIEKRPKKARPCGTPSDPQKLPPVSSRFILRS